MANVIELLDFTMGDDVSFDLVVQLKSRIHKMFVTKEVECKSKQTSMADFFHVST